MDVNKAASWLTFAGGVFALFLQIWNAAHGGSMDGAGVATASAVTVGGISHLTKR